MKTFISILCKCCLFFFVLFFLVDGLSFESVEAVKTAFFDHLIETDEVSLDQLQSALTSYRIQEITQDWETYQTINVPEITENRKKIYLYNTHQSEEYIDGVTIFEVTYQFAKMMSDAGFEVVFETADFLAELNRQNKQYNQLYTISRLYLNEALVKYGEFDLIIDVHRDSAKRSVSVVTKENVDYGRLMFVIGNKSSNAEAVSAHSHSLTDKMNQMLDGIMREPFIRQSVYNQDMADNMLLLEVGSNQNTSSEVLRSLEILVELFKKEGLT